MGLDLILQGAYTLSPPVLQDLRVVLEPLPAHGTAAIQYRASLFGQVEGSLPKNAGCGASVRSQQLGELCSLLVRAIRVSGRLPRGLAQANPGCRWQEGEGQQAESLPWRNPLGVAQKHNR